MTFDRKSAEAIVRERMIGAYLDIVTDLLWLTAPRGLSDDVKEWIDSGFTQSPKSPEGRQFLLHVGFWIVDVVARFTDDIADIETEYQQGGNGT